MDSTVLEETRPNAKESGSFGESASSTTFYITLIASSAIFFGVTNFTSSYLIPLSVSKNSRSVWRWNNISTSFVHALISGIWTLCCFYENPLMAKDLINNYTPIARYLVAFSIGYFVFDFFDMVTRQRCRHSYELMVHHVVVIACFSVAALGGSYVGYAVVALLVEVNSVFLHARQLMQLVGKSRANSKLYRLNALFNVGTFLAFRIVTLAWMTRWLVINRDAIPFWLFSLGSVGLAVMTAMNIVLFHRILAKDYLRKGKNPSPAASATSPVSAATDSSSGVNSKEKEF